MRKPRINVIGGGHVGATAATRPADTRPEGDVLAGALVNISMRILSRKASVAGEFGRTWLGRRGLEEL